MRARLLLFFLAVFAAAALGQERAPADAVTWIENGAKKSRTAVFVESATYEQVVFAQAARRTTVPAADVLEIRWGDAPPEYDAAVAAARAGDFEAARAGFDACLAKRATQRGWLVEQCALGLAEALLALANHDDRNAEKAAHAFSTARESNPRGMTLDRVLAGLSKASLAMGRSDAALAAADDLVAAGRAAHRPLWECEGLLLRIDGRDPAAGTRAADDAFARATAAAEATKDADLARRLRAVAARALARKAWIAVSQAQATTPSSERAATEDLVGLVKADKSADAAVKASMTNAEGALLLVAGDARAALRKFLEVEVVHFDAPDEAARALWYQAACHEKLGNASSRLDALKRLVETYPDSEWARRAR